MDGAAIAAALNVSKRAVERRAQREAWAFTEASVRGGKKRYFAVDALPVDVKAAILIKRPVSPKTAAAAPSPAFIESARRRYATVTDQARARAEGAARAVMTFASLTAEGVSKRQAVDLVASQMRADGFACSETTLWRWRKQVVGIERADWPAVLVDDYVGRTKCADFDALAQEYYAGDYLSRAQPTHAECYRRLKEVAAHKGWSIPSAKTVKRWLDSTYDRLTQVSAREGVAGAMRHLPASRRDESVFYPGQAVNGDGLKFDRLWVKFPDGEIINTATGWFWQDVRTRKLLAYRLGKTESTDLFRLATYDLTGICLPEFVWLDNTRVAANKLMTAAPQQNRHRFRSRPEDGMGLLAILGMEARFTNPDKETGNPGSKPIERAFGIGGLHDKVATNPRIRAAGGFSKASAISFELLQEVVAIEVARHNAQEGRLNRAAGGVMSLNQAWDQLSEGHVLRTLSEEQRRVLLMCREQVRVGKQVFEVRIKAGRNRLGENRYRGDGLSRYAGRLCYVHFDPENLHAGAHLYGLDGRYLLPLEHIPSYAFNDKQAGDEVSKFKKRQVKALKAAEVEAQRMDAKERAALYESATRHLGEPAEKPTAKVVAGHFKGTPNPERDAGRALADDLAENEPLRPANVVRFPVDDSPLQDADLEQLEQERRLGAYLGQFRREI
jgi:uncharacterized protein YoaH (UPF0181 family)